MGWSDILKYASYATPFIPGVNAFSPLIIGAAESLDANVDAKNASKQATEQLQGGNNQAIDQYKQALGPYVQGGQAAYSTLGSLFGLPMGGGSSAPQTAPPLGPSVKTNPDTGANYRVNPGLPVTGQAQPRDGTLASLAARQPTQSSYRTVRMRAPDGDEADIPEHAVQAMQREGAMVL
jgi:hypothetical protein